MVNYWQGVAIPDSVVCTNLDEPYENDEENITDKNHLA